MKGKCILKIISRHTSQLLRVYLLLQSYLMFVLPQDRATINTLICIGNS